LNPCPAGETAVRAYRALTIYVSEATEMNVVLPRKAALRDLGHITITAKLL
jgi:hypothetical protein